MSKQQEPPPTQATKIITLLEQNKIQNGDPNGTYSINLKHEVTLNDGDSITLTKGFIDTSAQDSNFIRIEPEETTITIKHGMYWTDTEPYVAGTSVKPTWGQWSVGPLKRPEGTTYILQNQSEAPANTPLNWLYANNPFAFGTDFNMELQVIAAGAPSFGIMHYILAGNPLIPGTVPDLPTAYGQVLQQKFILEGTLNLSTDAGSIDFLFYPYGYVVPVGGVGKNDHTAVFTRWKEGTTVKGWKAKSNPATTSPEFNGSGGLFWWKFLSDANGYNYFDDLGKAHFVQLQTVRLPFDTKWMAGPDGARDEFPSVGLKYVDSKGVTQSSYKTFNMYPPLSPNGGVGGPDKIKEEIFKQSPSSKSYAAQIKFEDLPPAFTDKNYGWSRDWAWYAWNQWVDPLDIGSPYIFPHVEFSVDNPPLATFTQYAGGEPVNQCFINQKSQWKLTELGINQGNVLQPYQMPDLKPITNPNSSGSEMLPREYTTTITIPAGNYTYDNIAQLLTDKLNKIQSPVVGLSNNPAGVDQPLNADGFSSSYLLQSTYELMMQVDGYNNTDAEGNPVNNIGYPTYPNNWVFAVEDIPERFNPDFPAISKQTSTSTGFQPYWVSEDGTRLFSYNRDKLYPHTESGSWGARIVGAENFSIIFDASSQRFQILQAHTPIYIDGPILQTTPTIIKGPGSTVLRQVKGGAGANSFIGKLLTMDSSSGVYLTDLQPRSLWFDKLGFDTSIFTHIGPHESSIQNFNADPDSDFSNGSLENCKVHPMRLETGRNKTGYFMGEDSLISKNANFFEIPESFDTDIEVNTPVGLLGNPIIEASDDQPFYNIEISGINNQDISGQVFENSLIQAIVGKYFSEGNFTESSGDGFLYTHKGTPLTIKSLRVRILDTQLIPEPTLGPNSAFILEINTVK